MNELQRQAVLIALIQALKEQGSWSGQTHIQKAAYFLQEVYGVPLGLNSIFYKHGPYSFGLNDQLTALLADQLLVLQPAEPYGAHLYPSDRAPEFLARFPKTTANYSFPIEAIARELGPKGVRELERWATALYVLRNLSDAHEEKQIAEIQRLKPHVTREEAAGALAEVREFVGAAEMRASS